MKETTITLPEEHTFLEALKSLVEGECVGIKPGDNLNYMELATDQEYIQLKAANSLLAWNDSHKCRARYFAVRAEQFLSPTWRLVVKDRRSGEDRRRI
jgi:hypothetical protein